MNSAAYSDYSRAKAMREVKALKLLQLFESGKFAEMLLDSYTPGIGMGYDDRAVTTSYLSFKRDVEDYLKDTD